jgi:hypothetical protein
MSEHSTVIQFAALVGKYPQQIYPMIKNGSLPSELVDHVHTPKGGTQPMIRTEAALAWFKNKEEVRLNKASAGLIYTVDALLKDLEAAGKKGVSTQIKNFIAEKNAAK